MVFSFVILVIEKGVKAHVVKSTLEIAPKSHNLIYLSEKAGLTFSEDDEIFLGVLMKYQLQGRYPDYNPTLPDTEVIKGYVSQTENTLLWLMEKL